MKTLAPSVTEALLAALAAHWTAIEQYSAQSAHFKRWGYSKLADAATVDANEEREHLNWLLLRLEDFDIDPGYAHKAPVWPRHDYPGILEANLALETAVCDLERAGIVAARAAGDDQTADILSDNLSGTEKSMREIEAIQRQIAVVGLDNYLANQV